MANLIVGLIIIGVTSASIWKYRSEKKKGAKCVGCPHSSGSNCSCK
ncbi:FeoB-associated Cys-rich membrane protein [Eubacteriaceae bacterium ES3]|nr:FeoB-associated Cys-rich membrane protein [Eubacteriaceae bacterium ES3]